MISFDDWFRSPAPKPAKKAWYDTDDEIILDVLDWNCEDTLEPELVYPCRVCEELKNIGVTVSEFDPDMHYCGGSPSCCP